MTSQLSTKFAALAIALMVNGMMIGGVAYLFSVQFHEQTAGKATAMTVSARTGIPTI